MHVIANPLRKAFAANSTSADFTAKIPTSTKPTGTGVFDLCDSQYGVGTNGLVPQFLQLIPFGGNSNNETFSLRVWGWSQVVNQTALYIPQLLVELAVTFGSIDGTAIATNMLMADTLVVTYGATDEKTLGTTVISPANDVSASALVHLRGCQFIEFDVDLTGTGDAGNVYWRAF